MEWTKKQLQIADYTLDFLSKDRTMSRVIHLDKYYFNSSDIKPSRTEEVCVFKALSKSGLIELNGLNRISHGITKKGINLLQKYNSFSGYYEFDKKLKKKQADAQKKANRKRKWDVFIKYVNDFNALAKAITALIPAILFILSIVFSENITTIKKTIQDYITPDTPIHKPTTTTDTIQQSKPITLKGH